MNSTGPRESSLIAIAIASRTGDSTSSSRPAPTRSSVRLLSREGAEKVGASIESSGIPPICSIERAPSRNSNRRGTTSTATPASRQTRSACSSSSWCARVKAIITRSTWSSSTRSLSAFRPPRQGSEVEPVAGAVVDEAREHESQLGMVLDALGEPLGHEAGADDERALAQLRGAVGGDAGARAREPGDGPAGEGAEERARSGACEVHRDEQGVHRPRRGEAGQHELRRLADAARPSAQVFPWRRVRTGTRRRATPPRR